MNSISQKMVLDILFICAEIDPAKSKAEVLWLYEEDDEEMKEEGEIFQGKVSLPFPFEVMD
jgi:hypothetical protein